MMQGRYSIREKAFLHLAFSQLQPLEVIASLVDRSPLGIAQQFRKWAIEDPETWNIEVAKAYHSGAMVQYYKANTNRLRDYFKETRKSAYWRKKLERLFNGKIDGQLQFLSPEEFWRVYPNMGCESSGSDSPNQPPHSICNFRSAFRQSQDMELGQYIRESIRNMNLTQVYVASEIGVKESEFSYFLSGKRKLPGILLYGLSNVLNLPFKELYSRGYGETKRG